MQCRSASNSRGHNIRSEAQPESPPCCFGRATHRTKGKGLKKAEENQVIYHAPGKFDRLTGEILKKKLSKQPPKYQDVFGHTIVELAKQNDRIVEKTQTCSVS